MLSPTAQAADNLGFKGNLVAEPCTLRPGDDALSLDMKEVSPRELYANTRTAGRAFQIHLEGCDSSIADSVTTTFSGTPNAELPGLLALDGGSVAQGIALGLETPADVPLPLNVTSDKQALSDGANVIEFKAYVRAEPQAIADKSIKAGAFTATSTFMLDYP
ncbi:fimbrial protein [Pseudomonas sp. NPDC096917]|uniref:fimbrial protein n=1 Tax=Pseudomonas sp. NPDC096917 TaxID=3364483 RepID=UPI00383A5916